MTNPLRQSRACCCAKRIFDLRRRNQDWKVAAQNERIWESESARCCVSTTVNPAHLADQKSKTPDFDALTPLNDGFCTKRGGEGIDQYDYDCGDLGRASMILRPTSAAKEATMKTPMVPNTGISYGKFGIGYSDAPTKGRVCNQDSWLARWAARPAANGPPTAAISCRIAARAGVGEWLHRRLSPHLRDVHRSRARRSGALVWPPAAP